MIHQAILDLLNKYKLETAADYENALKEVIQQAALAGLWRAGFFNQCAFYGGTSLRIFYGLQRFSEDLDFTVLNHNSNFSLNEYFKAVDEELTSLGFNVQIVEKTKNEEKNIESAFIKGNTLINIVEVGASDDILKLIPNGKQLKIKFEVDIDPPDEVETETKFLLEPIACSIRIASPSFLFAGKMHALLFRKWKNRVKGRDWYDFVWFVKKEIPLNLKHLYNRMIQSQNYSIDNEFTYFDFKKIFIEAVENLDIEKAKNDVIPFLKNKNELQIWSKDFFIALFEKIKVDENYR